MTAEGRGVLIIGGGVIGVACAHYLNRSGFAVTVIDKGRIGRGCSHGNCGLICPSHVLPLAEPGAIRSAFKAMLQSNGAFRIRPRLDWALWSWLANFARRCNHPDMLASGHAIQPLLGSSMQLYEQLNRDQVLDCEWQKQGLLFVYQTSDELERYEPINELMESEFGEPARRLARDELLNFEPALSHQAVGGWFFEHDAQLRPDLLMASWRSRLESDGVKFIEDHELQQLDSDAGRATAARASGVSFGADYFVLATGAWTPRLAEQIGWRIPIEPGKGYSLMVPNPATVPHYPMILPEHRVVVTPMRHAMRLGSIMEFAGFDTSLPAKRLELLTNAAALYLKELPKPTSDEWFGWRPMTYDSTPVIGPAPGFSNVFLATGHNMLGISMAPATGKLLSELIQQQEPHLPPHPYRAERFR